MSIAKMTIDLVKSNHSSICFSGASNVELEYGCVTFIMLYKI